MAAIGTTVSRAVFSAGQRPTSLFCLQIGGREETVSVGRLKPHLGSAPVLPAVPAQCGRLRLSVSVTPSATASAP
jgi:hypothetical protein